MILGLDQASKLVATYRLEGGRAYALVPGFGLRRVLNPRPGLIRLSVLQAITLWVTAVACLALALIYASPVAVAVAAGVGLGLGGAASNLCDRILRGAVVDLIVIGRWPPFNVADAAMVGGTALAVWSLL